MSGLYSRMSAYVPAPASLPFVSRLARLRELLARSPDLGQADLADSSPASASALPPSSNASAEMRAMEHGLGPWSFMMSSYAVLLIVMAVALNRMQSLVRPPPPSALIDRRARERLREARRIVHARSHPPPARWRQALRSARRRSVSLGQRALTSPKALTALRLPAIGLLVGALARLTLILLQTGPVAAPASVVRSGLYGRVLLAPMDTLLWQTFLSVCASIAVGAFVAGVSGSNRGSSFNLFGFAFLLHLYSSPLTHAGRPARDALRLGPDAGLATRPDWNVTFGIWLAVLELAWLQTAELSERWGRRRLVPTGVCGVIGLVHFAGTLLFNRTRLPSFTFLTSLVSLGMLLVIVLTAGLTLLTQLFTLGEVRLGELLPHSSSWPVLTDDWSIALLQLSTACLESSTVGGLGNEVASIRAPKLAFVDLAARSRTASSAGGYAVAIQDQGRAAPAGFDNLVRDLRADSAVPTAGASQLFPASPLGDWAHDSPYWRELKTFGGALWRWALGTGWAALGLVPGARWAWELGTRSGLWAARVRLGRRGVWLAEPYVVGGGAHAAHEPPYLPDSVVEPADEAGAGGDDLYARFLAGEDVDDQAEDDDPAFEFTPRRRRGRRERSVSLASSASSSNSDASGSDAEDGDEEDDGADGALDPLATYSDLPPSPTLPNVLLAHMTSTSPLTRSRYQDLILHPSASAASSSSRRQGAVDVESAIYQRRAETFLHPRSMGDSGDDDEGSLPPCAVCYAGRREVLLIPCLCLALCAECRAHLAVKTAAKDHSCPCCRTKVTGYSRIFVP